MATRKIRVTLSGEKAFGVGPLVDIDFNNENLDVDIEVDVVKGETPLIKEYTVDVEPGIYNLDIIFKNDYAEDTTGDNELDQDRNLYIEKIEYANDGVDYQTLIVNEENSNLEKFINIPPMGWLRRENPNYNPEIEINPVSNPLSILNSDFNEDLPRTDEIETGWVRNTHPGNNPLYVYDYVIAPIKIWNNQAATFNIEFS
jgi:hypothetical protein